MTLIINGPEDAPLWLNIIIYMVMYQWCLLAAMLPAVYLVIVKIFGFPLLQYSPQEVVIVLFPTKARFAKVANQFNPYFKFDKGVYWFSNALSPIPHNKTTIARNNGECPKCHKTWQKGDGVYYQRKPLISCRDNMCFGSQGGKEEVEIEPENQVHVYTHAINQPIYGTERREMKLDEVLNNEHRIKALSMHGIWIMKNLPKHFHRHYQMVIDPTGTMYKLMPTNGRQQFRIGFFHTLGVVMQKEIQTIEQMESGASGRLVAMSITNQVIIQQLKYVEEYHNFSANYVYRLLKHLEKIDQNYMYWVTGAINPLIFVILMGAAAAIGCIVFLMHGSGSPPGPVPGT